MTTLETILDPLGLPAFRAEHLGRAPLHLPGDPARVAPLMDWRVLNELMGATAIWSHQSLVLVLDKEPVPATSYAAPALGRDGGQVLRPDPAKVQALLRQGATLVLNDIDQLTPALQGFARSMEEGLGGKVQGNLYLSSRRKQGFRVHFDTHDVFAVHCLGEKTWHVFQGRAVDPIAHPAFKTLGQDHHDAAKGELWREVRLRPGDLLYLPRGQYHYALADEGPCAHIAFGVTYLIGLDLVSLLFDRLVQEPVARANLPQGDPTALGERLAELGQRIAAILGEPAALHGAQRAIAGFRYPRGTYDLPGVLTAPDPAWRRLTEHKLVEQAGRAGLVRVGSKAAAELPGEIRAVVEWVVARPTFTEGELAAAFPAESEAKRQRVLARLAQLQAIVRA